MLCLCRGGTSVIVTGRNLDAVINASFVVDMEYYPAVGDTIHFLTQFVGQVSDQQTHIDSAIR